MELSEWDELWSDAFQTALQRGSDGPGAIAHADQVVHDARNGVEREG